MSTLATYFNHRRKSYPIAPHASFIQVIDTKKLSPGSSKLLQCQHLREGIRSSISLTGGSVKDYEIFHGDIGEFGRVEAQREFQEYLRAASSL